MGMGRIGTKGPAFRGPQGHAQAPEKSTLGKAAVIVRNSFRFIGTMDVEQACSVGSIQGCGEHI